ncbi:glycine--tRNA ligase, partial [Candidatus Peregrinibacteria bacterium]|nr:glycine--tRNA ligase [Candidatus Peregrinibacteria bacterium]
NFGVQRTLLAALISAYDEDEAPSVKEGVESEKRTVLRFSPRLAPVKVAILPLSKKLSDSAKELFNEVKPHFSAEYDESGAIGRRYRRQDEIGTPFCVTVDFQTLEDSAVTIRDRDSMKQERIGKSELISYLQTYCHCEK